MPAPPAQLFIEEDFPPDPKGHEGSQNQATMEEARQDEKEGAPHVQEVVVEFGEVVIGGQTAGIPGAKGQDRGQEGKEQLFPPGPFEPIGPALLSRTKFHSSQFFLFTAIYSIISKKVALGPPDWS